MIQGFNLDSSADNIKEAIIAKNRKHDKIDIPRNKRGFVALPPMQLSGFCGSAPQSSDNHANCNNISYVDRVFNIKQLLLYIVTFLTIKQITAIRIINKYFNKNLYFEIKCIKGLISFNYQHYIIKNVIENEFGVSLKMLCKWFIVTRNYLVEENAIYEVVNKNNNLVEKRNDKSIYLFEIDFCEGMKKALKGEGEEWSMGTVECFQKNRLLAPLSQNGKRADISANTGTKSWKNSYCVQLYNLFFSLYTFVSSANRSIRSEEFVAPENIAVCILF